MSDALPLPSHPHFGYYKKLAKDLVKACGDAAALHAWATRFAPDQVERVETHIRLARIDKLADAQLLIARAHGFASWLKFARHIEELQRAGSADSKFEQAADAIVSGDIARLRTMLDETPELIRQRSSREHRSRCFTTFPRTASKIFASARRRTSSTSRSCCSMPAPA
jgi:hypothetical protein